MCDKFPGLFWKDGECSRNPGIDDKISTVFWMGIECFRVACLHLIIVGVPDVLWGSF